MPVLIDLGPATLERVRPNLVVVRFKPGTTADPASFQLSMEARKTHCAETPHAVLLIAPDDVDYNPSLLGNNQYKDKGVETITLALALVSTNPTFTDVLGLYYALHPAPFPVKFFGTESDAMPWLEAQLAVKTV